MWLPSCGERRGQIGEVHDVMYFRLLGAPVVCYEVDGVEVYEPPRKAFFGIWYIATKRLIKVTSYNVRFEVHVVQREPVPLLRIEDVVFHSPSIGYVGITAPFNVEAVKRIVRFAEEVNRMPGYTADLITVNKDGYVLHVRKMERSGKKVIEHLLTLGFDSSGRLRMDDVANRYVLTRLDLPITLFMGDGE
jgi:hypothetical protein